MKDAPYEFNTTQTTRKVASLLECAIVLLIYETVNRVCLGAGEEGQAEGNSVIHHSCCTACRSLVVLSYLMYILTDSPFI